MAPRFRLFTIVALVTILLDQLTKWIARDKLVWGRPVEVIANYWDWRLSFNTGSAFGMFAGTSGSRIFLSIIGVVATIAIIMILRKARNDQKWMTTALALVAGGAIGNVIDRVLEGKVTDFVVWKVGTTEWPAFNIADVALVVGVGIMFLDVGREQKRHKEQELAAAKQEQPQDAKKKGLKTG
jgi:signal peptidase II